MYLGGISRGACALSIETGGGEFVFSSDARKRAICLMIDSLTVNAGGAKFDAAPPGVGDESLQLIAQCSRARLAAGVCSPLFIFLQHFIDLPSMFPECSGVPASTPLARAKSRKTNVSRLVILFTLY